MTREEIIEQLDGIVGTYEILIGNGVNSDILDVDDIEAIKEAISALSENNGGWIPIEERKPAEDGEYLLWGKISEDEESDYQFIGNYDACGEEFGDWEDYYDSSTLGFLDSELHKYHEVLAWQPLPEPYKKGGE